MKSGGPKRDWTQARAKVEREGRCRYCKSREGTNGELQAAHVIGREHDRPPKHVLGDRPAVWLVFEQRTVPLCPFCHDAYDAHEIDLLPVLTLEEQVQAVRDAGGLELARRRVAPCAYDSKGIATT